MELTKSKNHDHFFIDDGVLYESYNTIRGLRYMAVLNVAGMTDKDKLNEEDIKIINESFLPSN